MIEVFEDGKKIHESKLIDIEGVFQAEGSRLIIQKPKIQINQRDMDEAMDELTKFVKENRRILVLPHGWKLLAIIKGKDE